jgi:hypothetical protein
MKAEKLMTLAILAAKAIGSSECEVTIAARDLSKKVKDGDIPAATALIFITEAMEAKDSVLFEIMAEILTSADKKLQRTVAAAAKKDPLSNAARLARAAKLEIHVGTTH